jgi:hypothetical protein
VREWVDDYHKRPGSTGVEVAASNREQPTAIVLVVLLCAVNHAGNFRTRNPILCELHVFLLICQRYTDGIITSLLARRLNAAVRLHAGPLVEMPDGPTLNLLGSNLRAVAVALVMLGTGAVRRRHLSGQDQLASGIRAVSHRR